MLSCGKVTTVKGPCLFQAQLSERVWRSSVGFDLCYGPERCVTSSSSGVDWVRWLSGVPALHALVDDPEEARSHWQVISETGDSEIQSSQYKHDIMAMMRHDNPRIKFVLLVHAHKA